MKIRILLLFVLFFGLQAFAQKEAAIWYFGENAGLDFNSGAPVALTDGALDTTEGCATISDFNGNLLFYTDGITVWDRNHNPMPNGTGLLGHPSSTQSGIIVPTPGNQDQYYVFTVDFLGEPDGLQYNIVDMTLNGGLGDVTTKNQLLETPMTEKVTAVTHANGADIWVLSHRLGSNEFVAYLVTAAGLNTTPVVSAIGSIPVIAQRDVAGYLKLSPDGSTVAYLDGFNSFVELYSFNNATGVLSNRIALTPFYTNQNSGGTVFTYGVEFSSDSNVLYVSHTQYFANPQESKIHQFNLSAMNTSSIMASATLISNQSVELGALQLGIDGKIYVAQLEQNYLGIINNPSTLGVGANYIENGISLSGRISQYGLPPFITTYFSVGINATNFCLGDATAFEANSSDPIVSISWDFGDGNTSTLENPTHSYATTGSYTVSVTVNTATDSKTETRDIEIYEVPVANTPIDYEVCNVAPNYEFNLATKDSEVLGVQSATDYAVVYFASQTDADNNLNPLPNLYTNTNPVETIYARIHNVRNSQCYDVATFDIVVKNAPVLGVVSDWIICDASGIYDFILSTRDAEVLNGQDASSYTVAYFANQADADSNQNPLPNTLPYAIVDANSPQEIFYRIHFNTATDCYETGSFMFDLIDVVLANTTTDMVICDDNNDGFWMFDLSTKDLEVIGTQNAAFLNVSYHATQAAADANINAINKTAYTNTVAYNETVYVRIENSGNPDCYDTTTLNLQIDDSPQVQSVTNWDSCDDNNDGFYSFDLTQKDAEILGNQSATNFSVSYYLSQVDADARTNALTSPYANATNPQLIFYRLEHTNNAQCYLSSSFTITVFDTPVANNVVDIVACDAMETGVMTFDFSSSDAEVLALQDTSVYEVLYFGSQADADANTNALNKVAYTNTNLQETIYTRIQHRALTDCYDTGSFTITINELPQPVLEETYVICSDNPDLTIDGGGFETWQWRDNLGNLIGSMRTLAVDIEGDYTLTVTETMYGQQCEKTIAFKVFSSGVPEDFTVANNGFSDWVDLTIDATGTGDFEYSVNGVDYQSENDFQVHPGTYTVYVRDKLLCRTLRKEIIALGYQKFFTPNGDFINEYWNILGAEHFPNAQIFIYDRQGKVLRQLSPTSQGWDGTYRGRPMPASDYWFSFEQSDGKVFKGHFALKR